MKNIFKKNKLNATEGFTLIETLVAVTIFSIALTAVISISARGYSDMSVVKNRLTASYLAEEGIEGVRALRDGYLIDQTTFPSSLGFAEFVADYVDGGICNVACGFDPREKSLSVISSSNQSSVDSDPNLNALFSCVSSPSFCNIHLDGNGTYYSSSTASFTGDTPFKRTIKITKVGNKGDEVKVVSRVEWTNHGEVSVIELTENLLNFIPPPAPIIP